ncbi:MAG: TIGR03118 family protein, partial [Steroidobacteraceae bacterium]
MDFRIARTLRPVALLALGSALLSACGGGSSGGTPPSVTPPPTPPTLSLQANPTSVASGGTATLT